MQQRIPIRMRLRRRGSKARIVLRKERQIDLAAGAKHPVQLPNRLMIAGGIRMIGGVIVHDAVKAAVRERHMEQIPRHRIDGELRRFGLRGKIAQRLRGLIQPRDMKALPGKKQRVPAWKCPRQ